MLQTYIDVLLIGVPLVLLATHWREAWAVLDRWFDRFELDRSSERDA